MLRAARLREMTDLLTSLLTRHPGRLVQDD
jgi:hypothetical protein